ncbi:MAG: MFS transporter, partial [Geminicoccaceae bacterium]
GIGIGNVTSLPPLIAQAEFSRTEVAGAIALATAIAQATYAFAAAVFGLLREWPVRGCSLC